MMAMDDATLKNHQDCLVLVLHAHKCRQSEQQTTTTSICQNPRCTQMRATLHHMTQCNDRTTCSFPLCTEARPVIAHWKNCTTVDCRICNTSQHLSRKTWQERMQPNERDRNSEELTSSLLNLIRVDRQAVAVDQLAELQKLASNVEVKAFQAATSYSNYKQNLGTSLSQIEAQCKERKLLRLQQQQDQANRPNRSDKSDVEIAKESDDSPGRIAAPTTDAPAESRVLPKSTASFLAADIRTKMIPILDKLRNEQGGRSFCFLGIIKKLQENQYTTPFEVCEEVQRLFDRAWKCTTKSSSVYTAATRLSELFAEQVDSIMKDFGYCCGRRYVFLPYSMVCHGSTPENYCNIPRNADYFVYTDALDGKHTFCKKCFTSTSSPHIAINRDSPEISTEVLKTDFQNEKNDIELPEAMVNCIVCSRQFHTICVLYHDRIWPCGYVCKRCIHDHRITPTKNEYSAHTLPNNELAKYLEQRVNKFLQEKCNESAGSVTIRVLASSDQVCEVKPEFKKHFGTQLSDGYPYRTKAIFAFQKIEGVDVILFGMHVQEYDSQCPGPNARRVYISYLDSVQYFRPECRRTAFYHEILIGYLEYVKDLGFAYAHIWAYPPEKGDDYIFHCHPIQQQIPTADHLQNWYKRMLDQAVKERVIDRYQNIKDYADSSIKSANEIPYFDGDFWTSTIEELLEKFETSDVSEKNILKHSSDAEEPSESTNKRSLRGTSSQRKKNSQNMVSRTTMDENDFLSKVYAEMKKQRKSFFVVWLQPTSTSTTKIDPDPLISCNLMEFRDQFLNFGHKNHCEFSTLRRAQHSTGVLLAELHSPTTDEIAYTCNVCGKRCADRHHCTVCEDFDLCSKCYSIAKHEHSMEYKNSQ